jgi:hypothetical protein
VEEQVSKKGSKSQDTRMDSVSYGMQRIVIEVSAGN